MAENGIPLLVVNADVLLLLAASAVVATWLPECSRHAVAAIAAGLLVGGGLLGGAVAPLALPWLAALFITAWWAGGERPRRAIGWALFITLALGIGFGLVPGISPVVLTEPTVLKPGSQPYGLHLSVGKTLVAVALFLWLVPQAREAKAWRALLQQGLPVIAASVISVPLLAWGMGYVHPSPGLPPLPVAATWMVINLLIVCTVEEGFFRGLVQRGLVRIAPPPLAIAIAALLFGLAHLGGGWSYVLLATVAGLGYGLAYQRTGQRIEAAILAHFGVNLTHFALFTYPAG